MIAGGVLLDLFMRYLVRYLARALARRAVRQVIRSLWWLALVGFIGAVGYYVFVGAGLDLRVVWSSYQLSLPQFLGRLLARN